MLGLGMTDLDDTAVDIRINNMRSAASRFISQVLEEACQLSALSLDTGVPWRNLWLKKKDKMMESKQQYTILNESVVSDTTAGDTNLNFDDNDEKSVLTSTPQKKDQGDSKYNNESVISSIKDDDRNELGKPNITDTAINADIYPDLIPVDREYMDSSKFSPISRGDNANSTYIVNILMQIPLLSNTEYGEPNHPLELSAEHDNPEKAKSKIIEPDSCCDSEKIKEAESKAIFTFDYDTFEVINTKEGETVADVELINEKTRAASCSEIIEPQTESSIMSMLDRTFLTLNRDDEHCSEEEVEEAEDAGRLTMHEVELLNASSSGELPLKQETKQAASEQPQRHSLVRQCRLQGARLLSWLRRFLRRRTLLRRRQRRQPRRQELSTLLPDGPAGEGRRLSRARQYAFDADLDTPEGTWRTADYATVKVDETDV